MLRAQCQAQDLGWRVLDATFLVRGQGWGLGTEATTCGTEAGALCWGQADPGLRTKKSCGCSHPENASRGAVHLSESPPSPCPSSPSIPWGKGCTALVGAATVSRAAP